MYTGHIKKRGTTLYVSFDQCTLNCTDYGKNLTKRELLMFKDEVSGDVRFIVVSV